ncbi:hypothetical protein SYK_28000 [Pseudodesulfovibrio nedwellii]|uniref:Uncharacterized protein n=1 Tax=Pseudodesulfovibrio nedwellii TaxID=2973072 RepID=A0ABN6S930_9BACT|nr:hypothetical protein SYK_28000 [Pseudodesulfovibrio nedwellii]
MKYAVEFMLKNRLGHLPKTEEKHRWVASFLNETPCRKKDLEGVIFSNREIIKMIDRVSQI